MSENLTRQRSGRVERLTLSRTAKRNALNEALCRELVDAIRSADADDAIGAILLTAEGKAFCAGMDLDETLLSDVADRTAIHEELFTIGARLQKPLVAAVQGAAFGGGVGLAANAHIVLAADDATFGLTEIRLAMWPYAIYRVLVRSMGSSRTLELSLTGRLFPAAAAHEYGLVHELVPARELDQRATELALQLATASADGLRRGLRFAFESENLSEEEAGILALSRRAEAFASADYQEGVCAFREKRAPCWPSLNINKR